MQDPIIERHGEEKKRNKRRTVVDDLWEDPGVHSKKAEEEFIDDPYTRIAKRNPFGIRIPKNLLVAGRGVQIATVVIFESLLLLAVVITAMRYGVDYLYDMNVFMEQNWETLFAYYEAGNVIPWGLFFSLVLPVLAWFYGVYRIILLNVDPANEHAAKMFRPILYPIKLLLYALDAIYSGLTKKVRGSVKMKMPKVKKKQLKPKPESGEESSPDAGTASGGGHSNEHSSYHSGPFDDHMVDVQTARRRARDPNEHEF